jgi:hypothetical protein
MPAVRLTERWVAFAALVIALATLALLVLVSPVRFMSTDEAKYLGIGTNVFAGNGPVTVFGIFFTPHSPLWPILVVAPRALFGVDPTVAAHGWNVLSAVGVVVLTAAIGWRFHPAVGIAAAAAFALFDYFLSLGVTQGLDLPAAALILAYLVLGNLAIDRRSVALAALAGLTFGVGFLVKEIALPFAPVPFLAAAARGVGPVVLARLAAVSMLVATVAMSWWFVVFAQYTDRVYRLNTPTWTLGPLAVGIAVAALAGWFAPRLLRGRFETGTRATVAAAWFATIAWTLLLLVFFARSGPGGLESFLTPGQVVRYVRTWAVDLGPLLAVTSTGAIIALVARLRDARSGRPATSFDTGVDELVIALLCGLPLVVLVINIGELPRHYVAQLALLTVLGAAGWFTILERANAAPAAVRAVALAGVLAATLAVTPPNELSLWSRGRFGPEIVAALILVAAALYAIYRRRTAGSESDLRLAASVVIVAVLVGASGTALRTIRPSAIDTSKTTVVGTISDWIRANVPKGSTIAFAAFLAFETADTLQGSYQIRQIREFQNLYFDPGAPLGLGQPGNPGADDWIAIGTSPRMNGRYYGYRATTLQRDLTKSGPLFWTVSSPRDTSLPILEALEGTPGIKLRMQWSWPYQGDTLDTLVFEIDPDQLHLDATRLHITQSALEDLTARLAGAGAAGQAPAARLVGRVQVVPDDAAGQALIDRLRALAAS